MKRGSSFRLVRSGLYLAMLLVLLSAAALAQTAPPPHETLDPAWQKAVELQDGVLTPRQHSLLNEIAFAAAVSNLCDGYSLERARFSAGFEELQHEDMVSMSAEEAEYFQHHLMFNYGVVVGLFMAEGALDRSGFCQQADEHRNDPEITHFWE